MQKMKATVRKMAELWAKAHDETPGGSGYGTPSSSTATLNEQSNDPFRPRLGHSASYASELSGKGPNAETFHLAFQPRTAGTPSADDKGSRGASLFSEHLVDRLSAVEWHQEDDLKRGDVSNSHLSCLPALSNNITGCVDSFGTIVPSAPAP